VKTGIRLAIAQTILLLAVIAKYEWDRFWLPSVWTWATTVDPSTPIRGRYVNFRLNVDYAGNTDSSRLTRCTLSVKNGRLTAQQDSTGAVSIIKMRTGWALAESIAFFVPEHKERFNAPRKEFKVKVTVLPEDYPRPLTVEGERPAQ
jgi:hypothetical protein